MKKMKVVAPSLPKRKTKPATSVEELEDKMYSMAYELSKLRMENGTASSQEIVYWLKAGSSREKLEREILARQKELTEAKTENMRSSAVNNELYARAIEAMSRYSGNRSEDEDYEAYI